ncbi:MAG TPA: adenylate/guanylate cyclase domain-containing protein [Candidatus Acidoferrales bacterium]|nr:adenylate/guanylate cyclase domain-containing protein [Candidatus Acidoferrales bacterium]
MRSRRRVPIQGYLAALLALVTLAIGISTASLFYGRMKAAGLREASATFARVSTNIAQQLLQVRLEVQNRLSLTAGRHLANAGTFSERLASVDDLWAILDANRFVYAAYAGFPNGDFLFLRRVLSIDGAPSSLRGRAYYTIRTIERDHQRVHARFFFYDEQRHLIGVRDPVTYTLDPRTRPWWKAGSTDVFITAPYLQRLSHTIVNTVSLRASSGAVLAADVSIEVLSDLQASLLPTPSAVSAIVRAASGTVFGFSDSRRLENVNRGRTDPADLDALDVPVLSYAFAQAQQHEPYMETSGSFREAGGRVWLYRVTGARDGQGRPLLFPIRSAGTTVYLPRTILLLAAPEDELIADALHVRNDALIICVALIVAMIPIGYWLARFISSPLSKLRNDALALRRLDFSDRPAKDSFIAEIGEFDETFDAMRAHVREHNEAVSNFVPHEFLEQLGRKDIIALKLGDHHETVMTMLFSDIRSFTTLSGVMTPNETFRFVNSYLTQVGPIIREQGGFVDKYIGDAIFALFPNEAQNGVEAGIEMQRRVVVYNEGRARAGYAPIAIGIGIHRGNLMLGTIGEQRRYETTVLSDAVNIASRMEGLTKAFGALILVTADVVREVDPAKYCLRNLGPVQVKGATHPVTVYEVCDADPPDLLAHKIETKDQFEIARVAYTLGDFTEALRIFTPIAENAADRPAVYFRDRCAIMAVGRETASWDGIEHMETK